MLDDPLLHDHLHNISIKRRNYFEKLLEDTGINLIELEILNFLHHYPDSNTFTAIMRTKNYAKSHVSTAVTTLVECGYIEKHPSPTNKKIYHLKLLPATTPIIKEYSRCTKKFRSDLCENILPEQLDVFQQVITQMSENLK